MLIDEKTSNARLNSPRNAINIINQRSEREYEIKKITHGPQKGSHKSEFTIEEKTLAAVTAEVHGNHVAQEAFGVSQSSLTNWKDGKTGRFGQERYGKCDGLKESIENRLGIVKDVALDKLMESMGLINNDKLKKLNGLQLSSTASNLAGVVQKLNDGKSRDGSAAVNIVLYSPNVKEVKDFKVVEV